MDFSAWSAVAGALLIVMALGESVLARLPLSVSVTPLMALYEKAKPRARQRA